MKKLAIHLLGHARTYKKTARSFLENIVDSNKHAWDIDVFMHTWDMFEPVAQTSWHNHNEALSAVMLQEDDIKDMVDTYKPKRYSVDTLEVENGFNLSYKKVNDMRRSYAADNDKEYDYMLYTRYDILFTTRLDISFFIDSYYEVMGREKRLPVGGG